MFSECFLSCLQDTYSLNLSRPALFYLHCISPFPAATLSFLSGYFNNSIFQLFILYACLLIYFVHSCSVVGQSLDQVTSLGVWPPSQSSQMKETGTGHSKICLFYILSWMQAAANTEKALCPPLISRSRTNNNKGDGPLINTVNPSVWLTHVHHGATLDHCRPDDGTWGVYVTNLTK